MLIKIPNRWWIGLTIHCAVLSPLTAAAAAATPTAQELLAAQDQELVNGMLVWAKSIFTLSNELALDPPLREAANQIAQEHLARMRTLGPVWIAQERAASGNPNLPGRSLTQSLYARSINELAIWSVESGLDHPDPLGKVSGRRRVARRRRQRGFQPSLVLRRPAALQRPDR